MTLSYVTSYVASYMHVVYEVGPLTGAAKEAFEQRAAADLQKAVEQRSKALADALKQWKPYTDAAVLDKLK